MARENIKKCCLEHGFFEASLRECPTCATIKVQSRQVGYQPTEAAAKRTTPYTPTLEEYNALRARAEAAEAEVKRLRAWVAFAEFNLGNRSAINAEWVQRGMQEALNGADAPHAALAGRAEVKALAEGVAIPRAVAEAAFYQFRDAAFECQNENRAQWFSAAADTIRAALAGKDGEK